MIVDQKPGIHCPICGIKFIPQNSNICTPCTLSSLDTEPLLSAGEEQLFCSYCFRYERPPWIHCQRESADLLGVLLKKVKGLAKLQIKDAKFVWTEPHSKRIRIKIQFLRTVNQTTKVQQSQVVEFIQKHTQCHDCKKNFTPHDWSSQIQIRQQSNHKRNLITVEQNLVKLEQHLARQKWIEKALRVESADQGFDIFYRNQQDAQGCLAFIKNHLPVVYKTSSQFVSHNERDNTTNIKITHSLITPKICKDDLLLMHPKWARPLGCSGLLLCVKVTSQLYFLDPTNNRRLVVTPIQFFNLQPYAEIFSLRHLKKNYIVLDNQGQRGEESSNQFGTWGLVIALADQMKQIFVKSQINAEAGQEYEGYCLQDYAYIKNLPTHLLVKKIMTEEQKAQRKVQKDIKRKAQKEKKKNKELQSQSLSKAQGVEQPQKEGEDEWEGISDEDDN